jgi:SH3-like domain-containing protein
MKGDWIMFCPECGRDLKDGSKFCNYCGADILPHEENTEAQENGEKYSAEAEHIAHEVHVNAGIYKLICISMGLCLIAGSVVWATIMLRDRIDSPIKKSTASQSVTEVSESAAVTTTAKTTTTTTTTTTTADPYTQTVSPDFEDNYGTMYVSVESLAMRIGPGYDYTKLDGGGIPSGTALSITAEQQDAKSGETWCYINYDGDDGWVCKSYLSENNPTVTVVKPDVEYSDSEKTDITVIRSGGLKLYAGPGDTYDVLADIPENTTLEKCGYNYFSVKWTYTCYNGQYGWIYTYDGDWFNPTIE